MVEHLALAVADSMVCVMIRFDPRFSALPLVGVATKLPMLIARIHIGAGAGPAQGVEPGNVPAQVQWSRRSGAWSS